ncbi:MAG: hypothetical protein P8N49_01840 [Opitutales bacterium]|nr:hypothetical protein [Opitutales bacterium]
MSDFTLTYPIKFFLSQLAKVAALWKAKQFMAYAISWVLLSWLTTFLSDRFTDTPQVVRGIILAVSFSGIFYLGFRYYLFLTTAHTSWLWLSKQVRKTYRTHGEKLLGIVEIASNKQDYQNLKTAKVLFYAEQAKFEKEISSVNIRTIFPQRANQSAYLTLALFASSAILIAGVFPALLRNSIERWITPWNQTERISLTNLLVANPEIFIPKNESVVLRFPFSKNSRIFPKSASFESEKNLDFREISRSNGHFFEFTIPPLQTDSTFNLRCGDFFQSIKISPSHRPSLSMLEAVVTWPNYLAYPQIKVNLLMENSPFLRGSEISLQGKANKGLSNISLRCNDWLDYQLPQDRDFIFNLPLLKKTQEIQIYFEDRTMFTQARKYLLDMKVFEDKPPTSEVDLLDNFSPILEFESRSFHIKAEDDFGISSFALTLEIFKPDQVIIKHSLISQKFNEANKTELNISYPFDPSFFGLQNKDQISLTLSVNDRFPERKSTKSSSPKLKIIGAQEHADFIIQKMEGLLSKVAETSRKQESLQSQTILQKSRLADSKNHQYTSFDTNVISELAEQQKLVTQDLLSSVETGFTLLKYATENPVFDASTLKDFTDSVNEMTGIANEQMAPSKESLTEASKSAKTNINGHLLVSIQSQEIALIRLKNLLQELTKQIDLIEARSLAQRLNELGLREKSISIDLITIMPHTIGQSKSSLSDQDLRIIKELQGFQEQVRHEAKEAHNEISRYYERTGVTAYQKVNLLMHGSKVDSGLNSITQKIGENITLKALNELSAWQNKFSSWARILENQIAESSQGGGEGSSSGKDTAAQVLELLKIKRKQKNILQKTKLINQDMLDVDHELWSQKLSESQNELAIDLTDSQIALANEALNPLIDEAHTAMAEAYDLLRRANTCEKTQGKQIIARDLVSDIINLLVEGQQKDDKNEVSQEVSTMEFLLMQSKSQKSKKGKGNSQAAGKTGGGNNQGGKESGKLEQIREENMKVHFHSRKPKTGGAVIPTIPPEFKEAMERYLEKIGK